MRLVNGILLGMSILLMPGMSMAIGPDSAAESRIAPVSGWCDDLHVTVRTDRQSYYLNDAVRVTVRASEDAYLFVYSTDGRGFTHQLLPNYYDRDNFVRAGRSKVLPSNDYLLRTTSIGWDTIRVVAISAESEYWCPPPPCLRYSESEPLMRWSRGYESARDTLRESLFESVQEHQRKLERRNRSSSTRIEVEPIAPDYRPRWGEVTTRIYVRSRQSTNYEYLYPPGLFSYGYVFQHDSGRSSWRDRGRDDRPATRPPVHVEVVEPYRPDTTIEGQIRGGTTVYNDYYYRSHRREVEPPKVTTPSESRPEKPESSVGGSVGNGSSPSSDSNEPSTRGDGISGQWRGRN